MSWKKNNIRSVSSACLLTISFLIIVLAFSLLASPTHAQNHDNGLENLRKTGKAFSSVAKKVSPAVVYITVKKEVTGQNRSFSPFGGPEDDFFKRFFGEIPQPRSTPKQKRFSLGQGSGFIISADGYILTNNHVVGQVDEVKVKLLNGREYDAKTVGTDPHTDIAVIKIDAQDLPKLSLGNSDTLEVGEWVLAMGNPFGLSHTLTAGIVSAKGRSEVNIADYRDFIQTDAAINMGNSGGPLVNLNGDVVGINTAILGNRTGGSIGIGFAIPINLVKSISDQLIERGSVTRGYLGIVISDLTSDLARGFGLKVPEGVLINEVSENSPADKAGLKHGDIIIELNGEPVKKMSPFRNKISLTPPDTKVKITVLRKNKKKTVTVKLGELPSDILASGDKPGEAIDKNLGITVQNLTEDLAEQMGYEDESGVVVTEVEPASDAAMKGIRPGTLIKEVNQRKVKNTKEFKAALENLTEGSFVLLLVKEKERSRFVSLKLKKK